MPYPPFSYISLDFAGPFKVRAMGNSRSYLNTRAIKLYATGGNSTDNFFTAYHRFTSNHGCPLLVVSDSESQLKLLGKLVQQCDPSSLNWDKIVESEARNGTRWKIVAAGCQWHNGITETPVKLMKSTLVLTNGSQSNLTYAELET